MKISTKQRVMTFAVFAALVIILVYRHRAAIPDDAMIYAQVAQNIANGNGWSFNSGEVFNATTSPIHTIVLASLVKIGLSPKTVLWFLYSVGLSLGGIAVHLGLWPRHPLASFSAPLLIICWPVIQDSIGLEAATMFALVAFAALAFGNGWLLTAGLMAGMVALTRPEGLLMGPILVLLVFMNRQNWMCILLPWLAVLGSWLIYSWLQFGSIFPHTAKIKSLQSVSPPWPDGGYWFVAFLNSLPALSIIILLATLGIWRALNSHRAGDLFPTAFLSLGLAQLSGYSLLGAPVGYWWYFAPAGIAIIVAATLGLEEMRKLFQMRTSGLGRFLSLVVPISTLLIVILSFVTFADRPIGQPYRLSSQYTLAAEWINKNSKQDASIAVNEIGYVGYFSGRPIRDMLGLLHEEAIVPMSRYEWHWWLETRPDFVILHDPPTVGEPNSSVYPWPTSAETDFNRNYVLVYELSIIRVYQDVGQ